MSNSSHTTSNVFHLATDHERSEGGYPVLVDGQGAAYHPGEYVLLPVAFAAGSRQQYLQAVDLFTAGELVASCLRHFRKRGELPDEEREVIVAYLNQSPKYRALMWLALEGE